MLPYLIAGVIGYGISKLFEDNKAPKYADGGYIDYSNFRTSVIGLVNDNKVLILQRGSTANWMPNKWSIVGGVIEEGEVPIEAMIRECEEEIGLEPSNVSYDHKIMTTDSGEIYYFVGTLESRNVKLDYENSAYKFISKDEINNYDFVPYVKEFILEIFSRNEKKSKFKRGGDVLLAPNGKPSNLTPEQYKLVRSQSFKAWFGFWDLYAYGKAKNYYEPSVKKIAKELKEEKLSAINEAVNFLSKQVTENDVLIPMPSRYGIATDTRKLAQKISEKTGAKIFDCLVGKKRKSVYEMKKNNQDLSNFDFKFQINCEIPKAKNYFIVDNVIGTGVTMKNALQNVIKNVGTNVSPLVFAIDLNNISKVVDENGEPLVCYHATNNKFWEFSKEKQVVGYYGKGYYFSSGLEKAKDYGKRVIPAFLNIKSVFELSDETPQELLNELAEADIDVEDLGDDNDIEQRSKRTFGYASQNSDIFIENLIKSGFYGLRLIYDLEDKIYFFIAFESNQIKLADGTNTTFDSNNNDIRFDNGGELTNNDVLKNFVNQVEAYQSNHYGTFNRDNLVESYHKLPDSIKEKIKPISTKNLFRGADGTSYKSAISFTKNQDYAKMFGTYTFPFKVVKENKGLIDTKRLSALLSKMRIANEIGDDEGEVIVIEPIFSKDIIENIEKFRFDNGGLVAPNGKPSNLTPEQYKLVRTPAFKKWFGDWENSPETSSKVVDENGEPLPVYHGTASDFNIFKIGRTGGIFFTNNKNSAERFSIGDLKRLGENPKVIQCFLNIRKYYEKNTNDEILINEYFNDYFQDRPFISKLSQKNILKNKYNRYFMDLVSFGIVNEEPKQKLISYNYDGVIIDADNYSKSYIVFEPEQIKLADGSNTTFDGENPDIRFMAGGKVDVVDIKQYNIGKRNYRFVEIAEKKYNKIELYRQADDGNYYGQLLYRGVPRYNAEFSSPMVNDMNQLYAYEPVSNEELFNAVKNKTKPFASFGYWLSYYTEEEIQKEIQSFIDECDKYDLEYAVEKISGENKSLERIQFQVCQKGTFDELFDINALIEDYANNDFDSYDIEKLEEFRYVELSYFLNNEWDEHYALTGLILGIPPKFTMALINMWTSYGLRKKYQHTENIVVIKNNNTDIRFDVGGNLK